MCRGVCKINLKRRKPFGIQALRASNQGLESSSCRWIPGQRPACKESCFSETFAKYKPVASARESHAHPQVHPSSSSRDVVARRLITRSGFYFARR